MFYAVQLLLIVPRFALYLAFDRGTHRYNLMVALLTCNKMVVGTPCGGDGLFITSLLSLMMSASWLWMVAVSVFAI